MKWRILKIASKVVIIIILLAGWWLFGYNVGSVTYEKKSCEYYKEYMLTNQPL